jgi:hypothetical protein
MKKILSVILTGLLVMIFAVSCDKQSDGITAESVAGGTGTAGSLARFVIVGDYMYVVDETNLNVFDISNPANTTRINSITVGFQIETVFPYQGRLYIGSASAMYIYSLTIPSAPQRLGIATHLRSCDPVVAKDTVAYVTLRGGTRCGGFENSLLTYNVGNPAQPVLTNRVQLIEPYGLGYTGNTLYVCDGNELKVFNISNLLQPLQVRTISDAEKFFDVIPQGNVLIVYLDRGIAFYDISNPQIPALLSKIVN